MQSTARFPGAGFGPGGVCRLTAAPDGRSARARALRLCMHVWRAGHCPGSAVVSRGGLPSARNDAPRCVRCCRCHPAAFWTAAPDRQARWRQPRPCDLDAVRNRQLVWWRKQGSVRQGGLSGGGWRGARCKSANARTCREHSALLVRAATPVRIYMWTLISQHGGYSSLKRWLLPCECVGVGVGVGVSVGVGVGVRARVCVRLFFFIFTDSVRAF